MTITAQSIIKDAVVLAQDLTSIRWPISEVCSYFNAGQREVVIYRPDAKQIAVSHSLVAGPKQTLPAGGLKLLEVYGNTSGAAVTEVDRAMMDASMPGWRSLTGVTTIKHFVYDPKTPLIYLVYPPAAVGAALDIAYGAVPTDITLATDGGTYSNVTGNMDLSDIWASVLLDYILYRMYSKDAEFAGNAARATGHYAAFANSLGIEIKATIAAAPNSKP